jgi:nuclear pore complex protein Nup107
MFQPTIDQYEKALYGAISGDVDSVLPVCSTWEDHVWANVNALFEDRVEKALLRSKDGSYWNKLDPPRADAGMDVDDQSGVSELAIKESLQEIFDGLLASKREDLRLSARDPFHVAQAWIVRGKINDLLSHYVQRLDRNIEDAASP